MGYDPQIIGKSVNFVKELLILLSRCRYYGKWFWVDKRGRRVVLFISYAWSCFEYSGYGIITFSDYHRLQVFWPHWSKIFSRFARQATSRTKEPIWFTSKACYYEWFPVTCSSVLEEYYPKQAIVVMSNIRDHSTIICYLDKSFLIRRVRR